MNSAIVSNANLNFHCSQAPCDIEVKNINKIDPLLFSLNIPTSSYDLLRVSILQGNEKVIHVGNGNDIFAVCSGVDNRLTNFGSHYEKLRCMNGNFRHVKNGAVGNDQIRIEDLTCNKV
jgi:hypothetical protein